MIWSSWTLFTLNYFQMPWLSKDGLGHLAFQVKDGLQSMILVYIKIVESLIYDFI